MIDQSTVGQLLTLINRLLDYADAYARERQHNQQRAKVAAILAAPDDAWAARFGHHLDDRLRPANQAAKPANH
jgi:hypothetical protein